MMKKRLWKRSIFLYCLSAALFLGLINIKAVQQQRATYLAGMFSKSIEGTEKDQIGVLFFGAMVRLFPRQADAYINLALCYYRLGEERMALDLYNKAVRLGAEQNKFIIK